MDYKVLFDECQKALSEEFEIEPSLITEEAHLRDSLGLDSLDFVDIVVLVQTRWEIKLESVDFLGVETFGQFCRMLQARIEAKG